MITYVQQIVSAFNAASATPQVFTVVNTMTLGNTLILIVKTTQGRTISGVTDSRGNTWVSDRAAVGANANLALFRCVPTVVLQAADTITVTQNLASANTAIQVIEVTGNNLTLDQTNARTQNGVTSTSSNSITTTQAVELVVGGVGWGTSTSSFTAPASPFIEVAVTYAAPFHTDLVYQITSSTGSFNPSWSAFASNNTGAVIASYYEKSASQFMMMGIG